MASCGDMRFKQRAVIEFLVAENESVTNIHRRLENVYGDNAVGRSTVSRWAHELRVLIQVKRNSVTRLALVGQQQQSLRRCFNVLMNSSEKTDGLQPDSLQLCS